MDVEFIKKHPEWPLVEEIRRVLTAAGYKAYLAGGCVRDALLGQMSQDLDVATDATPEAVEKLFPHVVPVGKSFGVCRVVDNGQEVEVATFREESDYVDGRRPEVVVYSTPEKDAFRRDFTVNAMFWDLGEAAASESAVGGPPASGSSVNGSAVDGLKLIDLVGGMKDLRSKILRTVGDPRARFSEDYLRILRAARFRAQLEFQIEAKTLAAMKEMGGGLAKVSAERVQDECHKAFRCSKPRLFFEIIEACGLGEFIFPAGLVFDVSLRSFFGTALDTPALGWAALGWKFLADGGSIAAWSQFLKSKKLSGEIQQQVKDILAAEMFLKSGKLEDFVSLAKTGNMDLACAFWQKLERAVGTDFGSAKISSAQEKYFTGNSLPEPLVRGEDLKSAGVKEGPDFKRILTAAFLDQLENPTKSKSELLSNVKI